MARLDDPGQMDLGWFRWLMMVSDQASWRKEGSLYVQQ